MILESWMVTLGVYVVTMAAAFGRSEVRHKVTSDLLNEVREDVKRINGTVNQHTAKIEDHASEIRRLRT